MTNIHHFDAILFDMDGTLVDSTIGVVGAWNVFKNDYPHLDVEKILNTSHGVRTIENLKTHCGLTDPDELEREAERFEKAIVDSSVQNGKQAIVMLPGVKEILDSISEGHKLPKPSWAICTSATHMYAGQAVAIAGVPVPDVFVASEDVQQGKPKPDPYLLGAKKAGVDPTKCLVVEDAPNGVRSGQAAGCQVLGLTTTHTIEQMKAVNPTWLVKDLSKISIRLVDNGVEVTIHELSK